MDNKDLLSEADKILNSKSNTKPKNDYKPANNYSDQEVFNSLRDNRRYLHSESYNNDLLTDGIIALLMKWIGPIPIYIIAGIIVFGPIIYLALMFFRII